MQSRTNVSPSFASFSLQIFNGGTKRHNSNILTYGELNVEAEKTVNALIAIKRKWLDSKREIAIFFFFFFCFFIASKTVAKKVKQVKTKLVRKKKWDRNKSLENEKLEKLSIGNC